MKEEPTPSPWQLRREWFQGHYVHVPEFPSVTPPCLSPPATSKPLSSTAAQMPTFSGGVSTFLPWRALVAWDRDCSLPPLYPHTTRARE